MPFSEKLSLLRRRHGWSQEQLARMLGITRQSVSKWESGMAMPDLQNLVALSELLEVSLDYLVKENGSLDPMPDTDNFSRIEARLDDLGRRIDTRVFAYTSRARLFRLPLVSIRFSRDRGPTRNSTAVGIIAIGNFAVGIVSIGLISAGLLSLGLITFGGLALGGVSIGVVALGGSAVGIYAAGAAAVGREIAVGASAAAKTAVGLEARGAHTLFLEDNTTRQEIAAVLGRYHPRLWPPLRALLALLGA